jgi:hypothetical protein
MAFYARFHRKYRRTPADMFNQKIQPRVPMLLQQSVQEIATYCKRSHTWKNRTGALEESINWRPPERRGSNWIAVVFAGGWAKAKYAFDFAKRQETSQRKRPYRYQRGERFRVKRGMAVFVNYARYVEDKGFPVLKQGWERYKGIIKARFKRGLSFSRF